VARRIHEFIMKHWKTEWDEIHGNQENYTRKFTTEVVNTWVHETMTFRVKFVLGIHGDGHREINKLKASLFLKNVDGALHGFISKCM
jgi:hypothetical protein